MENRQKKKRIRAIILAVLAVAAVCVLAFTLDIEKAEPKTEKQTEAQASENSVEKAADTKEEKTEKKEEKKGAEEKESAEEKDKDKDTDGTDNSLKKEKKTEKKAGKKSGQKKKKNSKKEKKGNEDNTLNKDTVTVTVYIECKKLSGHMDKITNESIRDYVPKSGVIMSRHSYTMDRGSSAYDATYEACRKHGVQIESSYSAVYDSRYVEGIGYIYETDAGSESGWMYRVNGNFPNYGCSQYELQDGDSIVWSYTCNGGKDLGQ